MSEDNSIAVIDPLVINQTGKLVKKMARNLRKAETVSASEVSAYGKLVEQYGRLVNLIDDQDGVEVVVVDRIIIEQTEHLLKTTGRNLRKAETISASEVSALARLVETYTKLIALAGQQEAKAKVNYYDHMATGQLMTEAQIKKAGIETPIFG